MEYFSSDLRSVDTEQVILGQCLLDHEACLTAMARLTEDDFTKGEHKAIWEAFLALREDDRPVDLMTVADALKRLPDGEFPTKPGTAYVASLPEFVPTIANVEAHCDILRKVTLRRKVMTLTHDLNKRIANPSVDVDELISEARGMIESLELAGKTPVVTMREAVQMLRTRVEAVASGEIPASFVTGIVDIDAKCWIRIGDIWVVGARSGIGKSHLGLQVGRNVARRGEHVLHISTEMWPDDNAMRISAQEGYATAEMFREPGSKSELELALRAMSHAERLPIEFIDEQDADQVIRWAYEVDRKLRHGGRKNGLAMLCCDYFQDLQIPRHWGNTRDEQLGTLARKLHRFGRRTETTVMLIAALKEKVQKNSRTGEMPVPTRSDIRETGVLSFVAPTIILLHEQLDETVDLIFDKSRGRKGRRWAKLKPDFDYGRYIRVEGGNE